jgi:Phosphopantetheine attachment site
MDMPLLDFGLDSLTAVELKNWIFQECAAAVQASEILDATSVASLSMKVSSRFQLVKRKLFNGLEPEAVNGTQEDSQGQTTSIKPLSNSVQHEEGAGKVLPTLPVQDLKEHP